MKLLEFSYKNILSYGNKLQKFEFTDEPQLILVEGENGAGKSSIKEALTVSIYGRSAIRKMKDIPNWINRNAYTQVKFISNSGETIEIDRGIDPNFSNIQVNGSEFNLPDKRKVDEFVEDDLARIPFTVFCNTISLSFDDFKSFVNLTQADKRKIVDRIFGIDILSDMRVVVKDDLKSRKKELELIDTKLSQNKEVLSRSMIQLDTLKKTLLEKKDNEVSRLTTSISDKESELVEIREKYQAFKKVIDDVNAKINDIKENSRSYSSSIRDLSSKLDLYNKNRCPHCLNDLTTDTSKKTKEIIESKKIELEQKLPALNASLSELNAELNKQVDEQSEARSDFYQVQADLNALKNELDKLQKQLENSETGSIQSIIDSLESDIAREESLLSEKKGASQLFEILDDLLSDSGIKKSLIDKIIPALNDRILEISKQLEFKFTFEFDSDFNPIISYLGMDISPESLSSGQRKKMNLIVLLAFIELIKMKHNQMNIMFLDEIFSSLDKNNVYRAIEILKQYSEKYNMTIFVVSHEALPEEFFDTRISVTQSDHFSDMKIISNKKQVKPKK
jgi:DNA repair exonuclease SbcCD ATPase subunit